MFRHPCIRNSAQFVVLVLAAVGSAVADDDSSDRSDSSQTTSQAAEKRAAQLVRKLGDSSFQVRKKATRELLTLGLPALHALQNAASDEDLEVRYRANRLFEKVRMQVHSQRLEQFLADPESVAVDLLPGLRRYQEVMGTDVVAVDEAARRLFVEMQRAEPKLFVLLGGDPKTFEETFNVRSIQVQYLLATPPARKQIAANTAALMFLATEPDVTVSDRAVTAIFQLASTNEFRTALGSKPSAIRRLAGHWITTETAGSTQQRILLAVRYNFEEGIVPALAALQAPPNLHALQLALLAVGRFGGRDHIPAVEKLFENRSVLTRSGGGNRKVAYSSEVRDVALAVATHLVGHDARKAFGFSRLSRNAQYLYNPNTAGFNSEATRAAAFKKWADWKAKAGNDASKIPPADPKPSDK